MKIKILIALLIVILAIGAVSASDENISSDNLTADEDLQVESSIEQTDVLSDNNAGTFSELSTKIKNTPQGNTLKLDKDYFNAKSKEGILISKSITIDGCGHTIDANKKSNIFKIETSNVILKNIVFKNGLEKETYIDGHYYNEGGAINFLENSGNSIIQNCSFIDCTAETGGAINMPSNENTITDCNFINCIGEYQGGAICIEGGYYYDYGHHNNISNCSFKDCLAKSDGGAVYIRGAFDNIVDCEFINCSAKNSGAIHFQNEAMLYDGGHRLDEGSGSCEVINCKFINCSARNNGGAICRYDEKDEGIANCSFTGCSAKKGGAIYFYDFSSEYIDIGVFDYFGSDYNLVNNCSFQNCNADYGGGVYFGDDSNHCSIINSNFIACSAKNGGGVFSNEKIESLIIGCDFKNNTAVELGGAVYGAIVSNCTFKNNTNPQHYDIYSPAVITEKNPRPDSEPISITMHKNVSGNFSTYISYENDNYTFVGTSDIIKGSAEVNYKYTKLGKYKIKAIINTNYGAFESYANTTVKCIRFDEYDTTIYGYYSDFEDNQIYVNLPDDANGNFSLYVSNDSKNYELYESISISKYNKIINFKPEKAGTYYLMAIYDGNYGFENTTANITYEQLKDQSAIKASNANVFYNDNGKYSLEVSDFDGYINYGNPVSVKIANTVFKKDPTWEGLVTVNIPKLKPGTYKITISYNTKYRTLTATKKLTVKHIVTLKTVKVKKSAKKLTLHATLKNKKAIKGKTVTFKFNGKTYKAKTDKKGIAKVTIKSTVLKKLKMGKKITYQATYLKDTVKKTVKVQK